MNRRIIILVGLLNIIIALGYFVSCQSDPRKLPERVNVAGLGKQIGDRSELQKEIADEAKKKAPEVEDDMENIKDLADGNIKDSNKIVELQDKIDAKDKSIEAKDKLIIQLQEEKVQLEKDLKEAHKKKLTTILSILTGAGIVAFVGGIGLLIFTFYTTQKINPVALVIAGAGAGISGVCILTIVYLEIIAITTGIIILLIIVVIVVIMLQDKKHKNEAVKHKKINEELIDTWEEGRDTAKKKHSLETKQLVTERKFFNSRGN